MLRERDHIHINFAIAYWYNCTILLLVIVVDVLLCLIYKLDSYIGMYRKKHNTCKVQYYPPFQVSTCVNILVIITFAT